MIDKALIIYPTKDNKLHNYFSECASYIKGAWNQYCTPVKKDIDELTDDNCNGIKINQYLTKQIGTKLLLTAFLHGSETCFINNGKKVFCCDDPDDFNLKALESLKGGLVYTNSCLTGITLGRKLADQDVSFFGYKHESVVNPTYLKIFVECDTYGLLYILQGSTLQEAKEKLKEKLKIECKKLDPISASYLYENMENITIYGNNSKRFFSP